MAIAVLGATAIGASVAAGTIAGHSQTADDVLLVAIPTHADLEPPAGLAVDSDGETFGPFWSGTTTYEIHANPDHTGDVIGGYGLDGWSFNSVVYSADHSEVFDSYGTGPADGTVYDQWVFSPFEALYPLPLLYGIFPFRFVSHMVDGPEGFQYLIENTAWTFGNYFSLTDDHLTDTFFIGDTEITLLDIPL